MSDSARDRLRKILSHGSNKPSTGSLVQPAAPPASIQPIQPQPPIKPPAPQPAHPTPPAPSPTPRVEDKPTPTSPSDTSPSLLARAAYLQSTPPAAPPSAEPPDLRTFLQQLRSKMAQLAEDFAQGKLNRTQFQEIYAHYQKQRQQVEEALVNAAGPESLQASFKPGLTGILRERHAAKILSYAIYDNNTGLPLASVGTFRIDTSLLVPMLSSFRSAATEMFGAGLRSTEIEGGHWLCFVPGEFSTLMVLFSVEPARVQLTLIEDLHRDFEVANHAALADGRGHESAELFTRIWDLDKSQIA